MNVTWTFPGRRYSGFEGPLLLTCAIAALLLAAGCGAPTEFSSPLSASAEVGVDARVLGNWYTGEKDGVVFLAISRSESDGVLNAVVSGTGEVGGGWLKTTAYPALVNGHVYYNVRRVEGEGFDYTAEGEHPGYLIVELTMAGDDLRVRLMRDAFIGQLAEARVLRRRSLKGAPPTGCGYESPSYDFVDITQDDLRTLFTEAGHQRLFADAGMTLRRLPAWSPGDAAERWNTAWSPLEQSRVETIFRAAVVLGQTGARDQAMAALAMAEEALERAHKYDRPLLEDPLAALEVQALAGNLDEALRILDTVDNKSAGVASIALALARRGRFAEAIDRIETSVDIRRMGDKGAMLLRVALLQEGQGDHAGARQTVARASVAIGERGDSTARASDVAAVQLRLGDEEGLRATLAAHPDALTVRSQFASQDRSEAALRIRATLASLERVDDPEERANRLIGLAKLQLDLGEDAAARETALQAYEAVGRIPIPKPVP